MRLARLKTRRDFLRVAETRKRAALPGLILQVRPHDAAESDVAAPIRVGFTVSRKVGNAVVRNRVRRRLRAVADQVIAERAKPHRDYVLIGRRETQDRTFADLLSDLDAALDRTGAHA
jgi:ribonuclease P protein component